MCVVCVCVCVCVVRVLCDMCVWCGVCVGVVRVLCDMCVWLCVLFGVCECAVCVDVLCCVCVGVCVWFVCVCLRMCGVYVCMCVVCLCVVCVCVVCMLCGVCMCGVYVVWCVCVCVCGCVCVCVWRKTKRTVYFCYDFFSQKLSCLGENVGKVWSSQTGHRCQYNVERKKCLMPAVQLRQADRHNTTAICNTFVFPSVILVTVTSHVLCLPCRSCKLCKLQRTLSVAS